MAIVLAISPLPLTPVSAAEPPPSSPPAAAAGRYKIQLAAYRSPQRAMAAWEQLKKAHADLLGKLQPSVERAELGPEMGAFFRLRAGPLASAAAKALCTQLKTRKLDCFVVKPARAASKPAPAPAIGTAQPAVPPKPTAEEPSVPETTTPSKPAGATTRPAPKEKRVPAFDRGAPPKTKIQLAPSLTFGGKLELEYVLEKNFDLNDAQDDDLITLEPQLELALSFDPSKDFQAFVNFELSREFALKEEGEEKTRRTKLELKDAFIFLKEVMDGLSLKIGRQRFKDDREWLYDERLDAFRVFYRLSDVSLELSISQENLFRGDLLHGEDEERINNYILYGTYPLSEDIKIAAYVLFRDDRSSEEDLIFSGLRSSGEIVDVLDYWLELAHATVKDDSKNVTGIGLDIGSIYVFDLPLEPSLTVGYALGTKNFRQTGLQDNNDNFNGVTRFKYYGELFEPELSNLSIFTGGIGIRPTRKTSVDLVYHYYLQEEASTKIRDSAIDAKPTGLSRRLGSEIDLIVGYDEIRNVEVELVLGYFIRGKAFAEDGNAFFAKVEIEYEF